MPIQSVQSTRLRLDCQAPIHSHQNAGDRLLDGLSDFSDGPTAKFSRDPLEAVFERGRGQPENCAEIGCFA